MKTNKNHNDNIFSRLINFLKELNAMMPVEFDELNEKPELQIKTFKYLLCIGDESEVLLKSNKYISLVTLLSTLSQFKHISYLNKDVNELRDLHHIVLYYFPKALSNLLAASMGYDYTLLNGDLAIKYSAMENGAVSFAKDKRASSL